jgi:hypothetical protein
MVAFEARHAARVVAAVVTLALASLAAPCAAALDPEAYEQLQQEILAKIEEIRARDGQYSPALRDELARLIVLYRENEDHALALVTIERALQVFRANSGLHSLEQVPLLMQRLESEEALGNDAAVWDLEQELLTLARRHPDDPDSVPVLRAVAARQMEVVGRVVDSNEVPPQMIYGCYYQEWAIVDGRAENCNAGSRSTAVQGMLADANRNHADAVAVLLRNEAYSSEALRELEMDLVRGAKLIQDEYERDGNRSITGTRTKNEVPVPLVPWSLQAELREPWRSRMASVVELADWDLPYDSAGTPEEDFLQESEPRDARFRAPYYRGRQSLRRLYVYSVVDSRTPLEQATALVQMADWDLLFSSNGLAIDGYVLAHGMLERAGVDEAAVAELFVPTLPVVLPAFEPNPLARDETRPATGYIDVELEITKYGRARAVEIRAAVNAADDARSDLVDLLRSSRFRPRLTDGRFDDSPPVAVRYHLYD